MRKKRLRKSTNKKLFGVAGGLAEYFDVDRNLVRVGIVVLGVISGLIVVAVYITMAIWMPKASEDEPE